jgi:hypothetical protein
VRYYLGKLFYDAVAYGSEELGLVSDIIARSRMYEGRGSSSEKPAVDRIVGSERMLFGTDHPFFPPLSPTEKWRSVLDNLEAIYNVNGWGTAEGRQENDWRTWRVSSLYPRSIKSTCCGYRVSVNA